MLQTPMLQPKETDAPSVVPVAEASLITTPNAEANLIMLDTKASSLRRAATALLIFSMICARPCPSSWGAWLGMLAATSVLCSTSAKVLCRARIARLLSVFVAIFSGYMIVSLIISYRAGTPLQIAEKVHVQCMEVPKDTFAWAHKQLVEHNGLQNISFLSRHMHDGTTATSSLVSVQNASAHFVAGHDPATWSQPEACHQIARMATFFARMMLIGSSLAHLFLFLAAVAVVKRACCLRCAAYRAGKLTWKCGARCKAKCTRVKSEAIEKQTAPTAKEMA